MFASNALNYLSEDALARLIALLARTGAERDLAVVVNEGAPSGIRLFSTAAPPAPAPGVTSLAMVIWRHGTPTVDLLGHAGPHGAWLSWAPQRYPYRPFA